MKFQVSTKPLKDALDLGVISQNVSKYYQKSNLAQVTANRRELKINLEAAQVVTELQLKGSGDSDESCTIFVDCSLLKSLVSTFESSVTALEYTEGGLILHSGSSKFTLPKMLDDTELELKSPADQIPPAALSIDIDKSDWKFIQDHQMYAIAMSFVTPVYTYAWLGKSGDVLVGDFDNSVFTHSTKNKLGKTCLLSDTIINLVNSLPEGAKLTQLDDSYLITVSTDGFEYRSEFTPLYETSDDEEGIGSYNADIILSIMNKDEANAIKFKVAEVSKLLNQAELLSTSTEDTIKFIVDSSTLSLVDNNVDGKIPVKGPEEGYEVEFKSKMLKSVISNFDEEEISASLLRDDDDGSAAGVIFWSKSLSVTLAAVE